MPETKVMRSQLAEYYSASADGSATYNYLNTGFLKLNEENHPQVDQTAFVGDNNATCTVTGYENRWTFEAQTIQGNPVLDDLVAIAREQRVGADCERRLVSVDLLAPVPGETGCYRARLAQIVVEVSPPSGEPKAVTKITGTFHQSGALTLGRFHIATKQFTPDA